MKKRMSGHPELFLPIFGLWDSSGWVIIKKLLIMTNIIVYNFKKTFHFKGLETTSSGYSSKSFEKGGRLTVSWTCTGYLLLLLYQIASDDPIINSVFGLNFLEDVDVIALALFLAQPDLFNISFQP
jgi:hypothetical protein